MRRGRFWRYLSQLCGSNKSSGLATVAVRGENVSRARTWPGNHI